MTFPDEEHPEFIDDSLVEERMMTKEQYKHIVENKRKFQELEKRVAEYVDVYADDLQGTTKKKKNSKPYKEAHAALCVLFCDLFILVCISFFL